MTPAQRAKQIFTKHYVSLFDSETDKGCEILVTELAIKCSIITVNEIIESLNCENIKYWNEVKNILNKM